MGNGVGDYPHNSIIRVEVTDTKDYATAENQAVVFWHLPYEKTEAEPDKKEFRSLGMLVQPNMKDFQYDIQPEQTFDIAAGVEGISGATGAVVGAGGGPVGAAVGASIAAGLAGLLELKWTYAGNERVEQFSRQEEWGNTLAFDGANGSVTFQDSMHMSDEAKIYLNQPDGYRRLRMGIIKVLRWNRKQWKADHFHSNGFHSSSWRLWAEADQGVYYEPYWDVDPSYAALSASPPASISLFGLSGPAWEVTLPPDPSGGNS